MALTPRLRKRIWRANLAVSMAQLMMKLGYQVTMADAEQQFCCELHGADRKPSARLYPRTNSTYCWACHKPRKPVDLIQEHENVSLEAAVTILEEMFDLPSIPLIEEHAEEPLTFEDAGPTMDDDVERTERLLNTLTRERTLSMDRTLWAWERFDQTLTMAEREEITQEVAQAVLCGLRERVLNDVRGVPTSHSQGPGDPAESEGLVAPPTKG